MMLRTEKNKYDRKMIFLLQFFSSEASAQSMIWLHCADFPMQIPSAQRNSVEAHVESTMYSYK